MPAVGAGVTVEVVVGKGVGEEVGVGPPQAIVTTIRVARISVFTLSTVYLKNAHIYHRAAGGLTNRSCWRLPRLFAAPELTAASLRYPTPYPNPHNHFGLVSGRIIQVTVVNAVSNNAGDAQTAHFQIDLTVLEVL